MWCDALGELLHQVDLHVVLEEREVAPCHELHRHPCLPPDVEQGLDELVRVRRIARPLTSSSSGRSNCGADAGGRVAEASMSATSTASPTAHRGSGRARPHATRRAAGSSSGRTGRSRGLALVEHPADLLDLNWFDPLGEQAVGEACGAADRGLGATADEHGDPRRRPRPDTERREVEERALGWVNGSPVHACGRIRRISSIAAPRRRASAPSPAYSLSRTSPGPVRGPAARG